MDILTQLRELFASLPFALSISASPNTHVSSRSSSGLNTTLIIFALTVLILLLATLITIIAYTEYHRLSCSIPWVKRLRKAILIAGGCCCLACLSIAETLSSNQSNQDEMRSQARGGKSDGQVPGKGDEDRVTRIRKESIEGEMEIANGTTERKSWRADLGQRERYGKLFKNSLSSNGVGNADERLLRDMEGSEDGVAILL